MQDEKRQNEDEQGSQHRLKNRDPHNLHAVFLEHVELKKLAGRESDERQRDIGQERGPVDKALRHEIEAIRSNEDTGYYVGRHVRKTQELCHTRQQKTSNQHQRN